MLDPAGVSQPLSARIRSLFEDQVSNWPQLRGGVSGLEQAKSREFVVRGFRVLARHIPHRIASTTAKTDAESIRKRACFLCSENLPRPQRVVDFGSDFVVVYNPYPILETHLTIVLREHTPQRIGNRLASMLEFAAELPGYIVLYNGPECGASAPDHMHFQAGRPGEMPLISDVRHASGGLIPGYSRSVFVLKDGNFERLAERFSKLLDALERYNAGRIESRVNVVTFYKDGEWVVCVFPRAKHRPDVFHSGELTWTPGAIDLCGIVVLPVETDLDRITVRNIEDVFREVSLNAEAVADVARGSGLP